MFFLYSLVTACIVTHHKHRLAEAVQMRGHNMFFCRDVL